MRRTVRSRIAAPVMGIAAIGGAIGVGAVVSAASPAVPAYASAASTTHQHAAQTAKRNFTNDTFQNAATGQLAGGDGHGNLVDNGTFVHFDGVQVDTVSNAGEHPFTPGLGLNATYDGRPVWIFFETNGANACWQMSGDFMIISTTCGSGFKYSEIVSTANAPDGETGKHGLVDVGASDHYGTGQYVWAPLNGQLKIAPYGQTANRTWRF